MIAIALFAHFQTTAPATDPLELAWHGQVQCDGPDVARKTCASIGSYVKGADGVIRNKAVLLLNAQPQIVMTSTLPVQVKAGAVCGVIQLSDLKTATFEVDGKVAGPELAETLRKAIEPGYAPIAGREICTTYLASGDALQAQITVEGERRTDMDMPVRWVAADAGFSVKP